jgi:hypothetical protein
MTYANDLQLRLSPFAQTINHNLQHQLSIRILGLAGHLKSLDGLVQSLETMCDQLAEVRTVW